VFTGMFESLLRDVLITGAGQKSEQD
jgi:hypothetical protein